MSDILIAACDLSDPTGSCSRGSFTPVSVGGGSHVDSSGVRNSEDSEGDKGNVDWPCWGEGGCESSGVAAAISTDSVARVSAGKYSKTKSTG